MVPMIKRLTSLSAIFMMQLNGYRLSIARTSMYRIEQILLNSISLLNRRINSSKTIALYLVYKRDMHLIIILHCIAENGI